VGDSKSLMVSFNSILADKYYKQNYLEYIQNIKIGIAGMGGIGSNVMNALVRSGFCKFEIIDYDIVEYSNLNRQLYFLDDIGKYKVDAIFDIMKKINPMIDVIKHNVMLSSNNIQNYFSDADFIFEAFDKVEYKKMILEHFGNTTKNIILSSGMAGLLNNNEIKIRKINSCHYVVGDEISAVNHENMPYAPRVLACASLMASIALELTYKVFNLTNMDF